MYCFYFRPNFLRDLKKIEQIIQNILKKSISKKSKQLRKFAKHFQVCSNKLLWQSGTVSIILRNEQFT